jgi:hypothetical protein
MVYAREGGTNGGQQSRRGLQGPSTNGKRIAWDANRQKGSTTAYIAYSLNTHALQHTATGHHGRKTFHRGSTLIMTT